MNEKYVISLIFFVMTTWMNGGSKEELFLRATQLYHQRKFHDALSLYKSIATKSSAIWENMGNCAYYLEDYSHALVYWRKAQRRSDINQYTLLQERIQHAYNQLHIEDDELWYETMQSLIVAAMQRLSSWIWQVICLLSWILLMLMGPYCYRNRMRFTMGGLLSITLLCCMFSILQYRHDSQNVGIILSSHAVLHTGTDEKLPVVATLKPGQKMRIVDKEQDWYRGSVELCTGWIRKDMLEVV